MFTSNTLQGFIVALLFHIKTKKIKYNQNFIQDQRDFIWFMDVYSHSCQLMEPYWFDEYLFQIFVPVESMEVNVRVWYLVKVFWYHTCYLYATPTQ